MKKKLFPLFTIILVVVFFSGCASLVTKKSDKYLIESPEVVVGESVSYSDYPLETQPNEIGAEGFLKLFENPTILITAELPHPVPYKKIINVNKKDVFTIGNKFDYKLWVDKELYVYIWVKTADGNFIEFPSIKKGSSPKYFQRLLPVKTSTGQMNPLKTLYAHAFIPREDFLKLSGDVSVYLVIKDAKSKVVIVSDPGYFRIQ